MKVKEELYKEVGSSLLSYSPPLPLSSPISLWWQVIDLLDKGQAWEHGIPLCKELCSVYETELQYNQLAATLVSPTPTHCHGDLHCVLFP